jgi:small subunit ribosomal protein S6e
MGSIKMVEFKLTISDTKDGKSYIKSVKDAEADIFKGCKIGSKVSGDSLGFEGYEFQVTGGSDNAGFPMRSDVEGMGRKKIYALNGPGIHAENRGARVRKTVRGNTLSAVITQVNLKVVKYGSKTVKEVLGIVDAPAEPAK